MSQEIDYNKPALAALQWNAEGLIPAIVQAADSERVLMFAWMNEEALQASIRSGNAVYWSRSRQRLWQKGEESGHSQRILELRTDCDGDVLLLRVEQVGGIACHTGRGSCFFNVLDDAEGELRWLARDPVLIDPSEIYRK